MDVLGLPKFHLLKHWTLIGLNCYLLFSLNFAGVFAQEFPPRLGHQNRSRGQNHEFRASPYDGSKHGSSPRHQFIENRRHSNVLPPPPNTDKVDTLDLSRIPSEVPNNRQYGQKIVESGQSYGQNSIDRFDAYGEYDYIDLEQHPKPIEYHKPLRHRPNGPEPFRNQNRPQQPQRRVDHQRRPYRHPSQNQHYQASQYQTPYRPTFLRPPAHPKPTGGFFDSIFSGLTDKNDNVGPLDPLEDQSSGILDPLLKLVGLKNNAISPEKNEYADQLQQYHDPLEYDYGDYVEGYQNYAKPQRPKTVPERIAKWFTGFRIPSAKRKKLKNYERVQEQSSSLDYSDYDLGDDQNLIFYNNQQRPNQGKPSTAGLYDFGDVVQAIRNNETSSEVAKKLLSAAAALSERSDSNPVFMMWTIPTTILALMGSVYFVGALAIIGYKYMLQGGNGDIGTLISIAAVFSIPLLVGFFFVGSRSAINGEVAVNRIVRGDFRNSMRQDFDGVDFVMDALFGSSALLGIGWLVSITV